MANEEPVLHGHIWAANEDGDQPIAELDIPWTGNYDDHLQFGVTLPDGTHLELRLFLKDIPQINKLAEEARAYFAS